jgi:uncharacterized protein (TIGR00725 family)
MTEDWGMTKQAKTVSVFGSSQVQSGSVAYEEARQVGTLLAGRGFTVCSGGYGGVMEAVSRGAKEAGGLVVGVTTTWFANHTANPWVDKEIRTATFMERLQTLIDVGHGYLALKGGIGTLTEISTVWSLLQTHSIPPRPFVLLDDPWQSFLDFCRDALIIRQPDFEYPQLATSPAQAVSVLGARLHMEAP